MPRIRTIKPEFWRNRQLAKLDPFTRLLAIAVLNMADDEGYFEADVALIRGDVFPFEEDSMSIHGALMELSMISYVELRESSCKGLLGYICSFKKHQVISRPSQSKLKAIFNESPMFIAENSDSRSPHGVLMESSVLEQGTGNREKEMDQGDSSELLQASEPVDSTLVFELVGKDSGPWSPTLSLIDQFEKWYPSMDVDSELRKAAAWHATNPTKRKTKSGITKFLNAWLTKANDRGGINGTNNQPPKQLTLSERLASIRMEDYQQ